MTKRSARENLRAGLYMGAAILLLLFGFLIAGSLLSDPNPRIVWASSVLVALPGIVLTVFFPALRDFDMGFRILAGVTLLVVVILGFAILANRTTPAEDLLPVVVVAAVSFAITALVGIIDWSPRARPVDAKLEELNSEVSAP